MADNRKYYYLKLKDNFFEQDAIKIVEGHTNGYIYSNILLKLYLKSIKHDGCLRITEAVPYAPDQVEMLARVINHDPAHVSNAINLAISLELMTIIDGREMWFTDIQNYIGQSSTEGDRVREHRLKLKNPKKYKKLSVLDKSVQMYDKRLPELEIEIETDIEIEKKREIKHKHGEYKNVLLTDKEFERLNTDYPGEAVAIIEWFSAYIEEKGYKSKSHNLAIRRWVVDAYSKNGAKLGTPVPEKAAPYPSLFADRG